MRSIDAASSRLQQATRLYTYSNSEWLSLPIRSRIAIHIGYRICVSRLKKRVTMATMAGMLLIHPDSYRRFERGSWKISLNRVYEIAAILDLSPGSLMPETRELDFPPFLKD